MNIYALLFMMLEVEFSAVLIIVALLYIALILTSIYSRIFSCFVQMLGDTKEC